MRFRAGRTRRIEGDDDLDDEIARRRVQFTSRASSFGSIATHEPGPRTPSGGRLGIRPAKGRAEDHDGDPDRRHHSHQLPRDPRRRARRRTGHGRGRGDAERAACRASTDAGVELRSYAAATGLVAEHPIGLVDLRHLGRRRAAPVGRGDARGPGPGTRRGSSPRRRRRGPRGRRSGCGCAQATTGRARPFRRCASTRRPPDRAGPRRRGSAAARRCRHAACRGSG